MALPMSFKHTLIQHRQQDGEEFKNKTSRMNEISVGSIFFGAIEINSDTSPIHYYFVF